LPAVALVLPGDPETPTGGYLYDRRILDGLGDLGWATSLHVIGADFPSPSPESLAAAAAALDAIPAGRAVVIDGLALAGLVPLLPAQARRVRLVGLVHHPVADETGLAADERCRLRRDERAAYRAVERLIVTSRWTARRLAESGAPPGRIRVVEPGTDRPRRAAPARAPAGVRRLLCVGTLTARKGHLVLLDALARVRDRPWRLDCVGSVDRDTAASAAVARRIAELGLGERVHMHGAVPAAALAELYTQADAFVLPSFFEGYGMALAEAVAHGLPIVATHAGAAPETIGDAGLLVPPGDVDALAAALERLLGDPALCGQLAARARARARRLPTWAEASARFAAALADIAVASDPTP
jgi:glycosyltransferase involved in cell wall biosynthesis